MNVDGLTYAGRRQSPAPVPRGALVLLVTMALVATSVVGQTVGWSKTWTWISDHWRLDVGVPRETAPYPSDIGHPSVRLVAVGDVGTGGPAEFATARAVDNMEPARELDGLLLLGDNVYPSGRADQVQPKVLDPFAGVLDGPTDLVATLGNHDVQTGGGEPVIEALGLPDRWYATRFGPVRVVVVDSTRADDPAQLRWLKRALAAPTDATWTVVMGHHPPFSAGHHGSHGPSKASLVPLYEAAGVDLVLAGHDHDYQRTTPQHGVVYVVSGAGAKLRRTARAGFTATAASTYSFVELAAYPDALVVRAVDQHGRVFDTFTLAR